VGPVQHGESPPHPAHIPRVTLGSQAFVTTNLQTHTGRFTAENGALQEKPTRPACRWVQYCTVIPCNLVGLAQNKALQGNSESCLQVGAVLHGHPLSPGARAVPGPQHLRAGAGQPSLHGHHHALRRGGQICVQAVLRTAHQLQAHPREGNPPPLITWSGVVVSALPCHWAVST